MFTTPALLASASLEFFLASNHNFLPFFVRLSITNKGSIQKKKTGMINIVNLIRFLKIVYLINRKLIFFNTSIWNKVKKKKQPLLCEGAY